MTRAVAFKTHTGLLIGLETEAEEYVVTITGDRVKELLRTPVLKAARTYYDNLVETYQQREKDEAQP